MAQLIDAEVDRWRSGVGSERPPENVVASRSAVRLAADMAALFDEMLA
jgi:hypothetical protein